MSTNELVCARLRVSYDRGTKRNKPEDLGLEETPESTTDGGLVRGLGSHYRSEQARDRAKELANVESKVRTEFSRAFPASPLDGVYLLPDWGAGQRLVEGLDFIPVDMRVHVFEFAMGIRENLPPEELVAWGKRVQGQLTDVPLGRKKAADAVGLKTIEQLASCPILSEETQAEILQLVKAAKLEAIDRMQLRRFLGNVEVKIDVTDQVLPRRTRIKPEVVDDEGQVRPRRAPAAQGGAA